MRRTSIDSTDVDGQDSFLDIVANIVGILIILVMVVGVRVGKAPIEAPTANLAADPPTATLSQSRKEAASLRSEVAKMAVQSQMIQSEAEMRRLAREKLNTMVVAAKEEMSRRRETLEADAQQEYDLRIQLMQARLELDQIAQARMAAETEMPESAKIESLPTPLSKTVHDQEVQFQLVGERLTHIPIDDLLERLKSTAKQKLWKLEGQSSMTDTVGPIDGFRLRYTFGRFEVSPETQIATGYGGHFVQLVHWEVLPTSSDLGETLEEALAEGSQFREVLAKQNPRKTTITIWTYPDSFAMFGALKRELFSLGYQTAARPKPEGMRIGASIYGSKSAAQ